MKIILDYITTSIIYTYKKGIVQLAMFEDTVPGNRKLVDIAPTRNQPWKSSSCFA